MKREKTILCSVNDQMNKHEWSLEEKKSLQRYIQEKKINEKNQEKKWIIVRYLWKTNKTCVDLS